MACIQSKRKPRILFSNWWSSQFPDTSSYGQLKKPLSTATHKFEIGDNTFAEHFVVMKTLTGPINELHFLRKNSVVIDTTHGLIHFPHLTMQVETASSETTTKPQPVITDDSLMIPLVTTKTITAFVDHPSKWNATGTVTPSEKFTETASLLISHSMSTIIDKKSSQSNQCNGITISNQKAHRDCRVLRSHSGAIQTF